MQHTGLIGKFYLTCNKFVDSYKKGGNQKLQQIIGSELFVKINKSWLYNNSSIISMDCNQLTELINKVDSKRKLIK